MKRTILILLIIISLFAVGCQNATKKSDYADTNNEQVIEKEDISTDGKKEDMKPADGNNPNGKIDIVLDDIDKTSFSQEQLDMLEKLENGEITLQELISNGVFTREELGMGRKQNMIPPKEDLNLEGLSQQQLDSIEKLYNDEITMQELLDSFTASEIESIGLRGQKKGPRQNQ